MSAWARNECFCFTCTVHIQKLNKEYLLFANSSAGKLELKVLFLNSPPPSPATGSAIFLLLKKENLA